MGGALGTISGALDYTKLARVTRWVAVLAVYAAEGAGALGWRDFVADPGADACRPGSGGAAAAVRR